MGKCSVMKTDGSCELLNDTPSGSKSPASGNRPSNDVKISAPVGLNSPNIYDDVFNIQYALDKVPPIDGGPSPQLVIDGKCGPKTVKAIQNFQLKHFGWSGADGKIEPNKQTHRKLIEISNRYDVYPTLPLDLKTDDWFLAAMMQHVPYTVTCIHAAMAKILLAMQAADSPSPGGLLGSFGREERMSLLNRHFTIDGFPAPRRRILQRLYDIYGYMLNVLNRPDNYFTLDTDNSGERISTVAFARLGGFFSTDATGKIVFRRGAYFATGIQEFAAFVFIHELRHFVERESEHGHFAKGWITDPGMQALLPSQKIYNCDTFAGFALEARNGIMERPSWIKSSVFR
jgi:hypothetical protein